MAGKYSPQDGKQPLPLSCAPTHACPLTTDRHVPVAVNMKDARMIVFYATKAIIDITLGKAMFEQAGWVAPALDVYYAGTFDPKDGWKSKARGQVLIKFDGEPKRRTLSLAYMLKFDLYIKNLQKHLPAESSGGEESPSLPDTLGSSDEDMNVGVLAARAASHAYVAANATTPALGSRGKRACAAAASIRIAGMEEVQEAALNSSDDDSEPPALVHEAYTTR